jgi:hypothetical protein
MKAAWCRQVAAMRNSLWSSARAKNNISIDAKLDRFGADHRLPFKTGVQRTLRSTRRSPGRFKVAGLPDNMSGVADVSLGAGQHCRRAAIAAARAQLCRIDSGKGRSQF